MSYDGKDIREWIVEVVEEQLDEAFMPIQSLASQDTTSLFEVRSSVVNNLVEGFARRLFESGLDARTVPKELYDALEEAIVYAFDAGIKSAKSAN